MKCFIQSPNVILHRRYLYLFVPVRLQHLRGARCSTHVKEEGQVV